jgi:antitoxin component YwqK of YwqJK toxin-antitoxin module
MRLVFVAVFSFLFIPSLYSQCKKIDALDKLLDKQQYQKANDKAEELAKKEKSEAYPYYFLAKLNLVQFEKNSQLIYLSSSLNSAFRAINRDKSKACWNMFDSTLIPLRKHAETIADSFYEASNMDNAKMYYDLIAKVYGDTTKNYLSILFPKIEEHTTSAVNEYSQAKLDFEAIPKDELIKLNQSDANGIKQGRWIKFYENGLMAYNVYFVDGKPVGDYYRYHENGARKAFLHYDKNGFASVSLFDDDTTRIADGFYKGINKDSLWTYFYPDGKKAITVSYSMGVENGRSKTFYQEGNLLEELDWVNGKKNGIWRQFYPNNQKRLETKFVNNEKNGPFYLYHENGAFDEKGTYKNGLRNGRWEYYDKSNNIIKTEFYKDGKLPIEVSLDSLNAELNIQTALFEQAKKTNKSVEEIKAINSKIIEIKKEIAILEPQSPDEKENTKLKFLDEKQPASADPMNYVNNPLEFIQNNKNK